MRLLAALLFGTVSLAPCWPAVASSSAWHEGQGGRVRLVTSGAPDAAGRLQGALEVDLKPGWKTYWRDPGDSGVPPQIDVSASSNISGADLSFPPPQRHDDGYGKWAGYDRSVSLPVLFTLTDPAAKATIDAGVFLGMCETICIPVQARLTLDPAVDAGDEEDSATVQAALAALPAEATAAFGATVLQGDPETLLVEARVPGDPAAADFFVAASGDYLFGTPQRQDREGKLFFSVPILDRPASVPSGAGLHYTLVGESGAVSGLLPYP